MENERQQLLKAAIADCFKNHETVTPGAVKSHLPDDFFIADFDTGEPMTDVEIFDEIQATFNTAPKPALMVETNPDGAKLAHQLLPDDAPGVLSAEESDSLRETWSPETVTMPVQAAPVAKEATASHGASGPGPSAQVRLNAAYQHQGDLVGARNRLAAEHRNAQEVLALAVQAYQRHDPNRQTPEDVAREFREQSQRDRAARGAYRLTPTAPAPRGEIAYVDQERKYSQGGDANTFVRSRARTLNRRGAYSKQEAARSAFINRDPRRGGVPAPVVVRKPTIPALAK
jgi:hypothetical protein